MKTPIHFPITSGSSFRRSALSLAVLAALPALVIGAEPEPTLAARMAPAAQLAATLSPAPSPALSDSAPADPDLKFVVAVFRHGVRSPLEDLNAITPGHPLYSGPPWPPCSEWTGGIPCGTPTPTPPGIGSDWGYLTPHGATAVTLLGAWYGRTYSNAWGKSFKAYLWADTDERTEATAAALKTGLGPGINVTIGSLPPPTTDLLFHPFKAMCGTPKPEDVTRVVGEIRTACQTELPHYKDQLAKLEDVLACPNKTNCDQNAPCVRLSCLANTACSPTPAPTTSPRPASPISWDGEFSYAALGVEVRKSSPMWIKTGPTFSPSYG